LHKVQAVIFSLLAALAFLAYPAPSSLQAITFFGPIVGIIVSAGLLTMLALYMERSWRSVGPVYKSHLTAGVVMYGLLIGANKGWWPNLAFPGLLGLCLAAIAIHNFLLVHRWQEDAQ